jgi:hypothetical protein
MKAKSVTLLMFLFVIVLHSFAQSVTLPKFNAADEATHWIYSNIRYVGGAKTVRQAQTPEQTLILKTGNCVDMSVLLVAILINSGANPAEVRLVGLQSTSGSRHILVQFQDMYFDCTDDDYSYNLPSGYFEIPLYTTN